MYQIDNDSLWNSELYQSLMEDKRIFSSQQAREIRQDLEHLGALPELENHHNWATLCIGYCFAKGLNENKEKLRMTPSTKGYEILSFKTCFQDNSYLWLAVLSESLFRLHNKPVTKDDLYQYIQQLWHVGATELWEHWEKCKQFKESDLEARQLFLQELANLAAKNITSQKVKTSSSQVVSENSKKIDIQELEKAFETLNIPFKFINFISRGVRYDIYEIELLKFLELSKKHPALCSALGVSASNLIISQNYGKSFSYQLKVLRDSSDWINLNKDDFESALRKFNNNQSFILPICIGVSEDGEAIFNDLTSAPHLLVAGTTGSGKSVTTRAILQSLFTLNDDNSKIEVAILDPKKVDYKQFENEQNLYSKKIIDNPKEMLSFLKETVAEMENRYNLMSELGVDNWIRLRENKKLPYRIVLVDELADLLAVNKDVEALLTRLAQKARAAGIHLILSTQRPDAATLVGTLRSNIPSRIAMKVQKSTESTIILDEIGAENLLGKGDHLIKWVGEHTYFAHSYNI
ncbi:FtsK/SpoIIIE domain-containing protein [Psychrobacter phenylpyruvicus]|uniref:Stage III sporulation protein E n=1 Tax=Psychrobacter phenylpyruvicus TaxID=29432 RepID=A0A379LNJ6_9GAMM|nr:FtsK/SpoIIIE domain-containing protein [Psychrobacter phenylpyruvicus]SUD92169.1 Stage III sporulation protein E [Psychrobacter phenylpyruvicus]